MFAVTEEAARFAAPLRQVRRFRLTVAEGPAAGLTWESSGDSCAIGFDPVNEVNLPDPTVSRFHCEVRIDEEGARVRDLGSRNGTVLDGVLVKEAFLRGGSTLRLGRSVLRFQLDPESNALPVSAASRFGGMVGRSAAMRAVFAVLERAACNDSTVLLEGETGTGKGAAAEAIHGASRRAKGPFVVVDCGALPPTLLESELFGHERGSFTGAEVRRIGAFEEADGGTIFLDEIGELPLELQPRLLRVLERREVRRVGANTYLPADVRMVAATNRDLRSEVNAGRFRADLYYRLAVIRTALPPLRQRVEDLPDLVDAMLAGLGAGGEAAARLRAPELVTALARAAWPGNVRELRNYLERCVVLGDMPPPEDGPALADPSQPVLPAGLSMAESRRLALAEFEARYLHALMAAHGGRVAAAARAAGLDRTHFYRVLRKYGIRSTLA